MIPVAVRLSNANVDAHITNRVGGLSWRTMIPGGFGPAQFDLQSPIDVNDPLLAPFTRAYIYDARSAEVLWEGELQAPGRTAADRGEVWSLTGIGPAQHTLDREVPLIYLDRSLDAGWARTENVTPGAEVGVTDNPGTAGQSAQVFRFPTGQLLVTDSRVVWRYHRIVEAGQKLARFSYTWDGGRTSGSLGVQSIARGGGADIAVSGSLTTSGSSVSAIVVTDFANGRNTIENRLIWTGGGATVADDVTWLSIFDWTVEAMRLKKDGTEVTTGYTGAMFTHWVVEDLLGRLLTRYDGANAVLTDGTAVIDQLAYPDGVTPSQVFDDLMMLEPDHYWAAWESTPAGKYRFEWSKWPTTVRYEASVVDGFDAPAQAWEQYNRVTVRWADPSGVTKVTARTQTIPELVGRTREELVDLADEVGSTANAILAGDAFLSEHRYPPNGGTLTLARPIADLVAGRRVDPWQIRPGNLIRVRGVEGSVDSLNASARDGQTVFRVVSVSVNGDDGTATLELDGYGPTLDRLVATLATRRIRKR